MSNNVVTFFCYVVNLILVDQNTAWLWGGGAGVNPVYVSYLLFDISAFAVRENLPTSVLIFI